MLTMNDIIREGHPTLRKVAEEVVFPLDDDTKETAHKMLQFLKNSQDPELAEKYQLRPGVGIAAPQINISKRYLAVHLPGEDGADFSEVIFNPKIISHSVGQSCLADGEGCLSVDRQVPGIVPRHDKITIQYYDIDGNKHEERLRAYLSIVVQHEIDHLNGVMFYDRIDETNPLALPDDIKVLGADEETEP
ncbi:peptide deformylase [Dolosigranulum pigrum]|uniref:Peptide deformylase n=1 Tax=Dolosigranulum pigrum TaxID=29394 RepID=A0A516GJN4_9LACT|nr:peptide deformylase [Dolosigranulum pigrum]QDO91724.1 peptide deformylase [Dolosigranulum pigrum]